MANTRRDRTRKTYSIFASFIMCCLGTSLTVSSIATQYWFVADCKSSASNSKGQIHFGLFSGSRTIQTFSFSTHNIKIVCSDDGDCMYSCGKTKELRKEQLQMVMDGTSTNFSIVENCDIGTAALGAARAFDPLSIASFKEKHEPHILSFLPRVLPWNGRMQESVDAEELMETKIIDTVEDVRMDKIADINDNDAEVFEDSTDSSTAMPVDPQDPEFMSQGLWAGTIACLVVGMVFAVVGALFAVINTATTPVEAITGVPGLYLWNGIAALFNLICVILWAVQFHLHLTKNVLLYDAPSGWTTEGMEVFGYSYWLVVVAIIVHVANMVIIYVGTYERKVKEQIERPEDKTRNIMLY